MKNACRKVLEYMGWMIELHANVDRRVIWFHKGFEFFFGEVQLDIKEVCSGDVDLVGEGEAHPMALKSLEMAFLVSSACLSYIWTAARPSSLTAPLKLWIATLDQQVE